jgi:PTH2 family peptidyl-tRNA hydrolase
MGIFIIRHTRAGNIMSTSESTAEQKIKQVIVIRRDLKMRRGKEIAQGSHASIMWLSERLRKHLYRNIMLSREEMEWMSGTFTKVTLQVESEEALLEVFFKAREAGLTVSLVTDSGKTEFDGVPTKTCIAIGPNKADDIDKITGHLKLY